MTSAATSPTHSSLDWVAAAWKGMRASRTRPHGLEVPMRPIFAKKSQRHSFGRLEGACYSQRLFRIWDSSSYAGEVRPRHEPSAAVPLAGIRAGGGSTLDAKTRPNRDPLPPPTTTSQLAKAGNCKRLLGSFVRNHFACYEEPQIHRRMDPGQLWFPGKAPVGSRIGGERGGWRPHRDSDITATCSPNTSVFPSVNGDT
jgi:hypothetical protein